MNNKCCKPQINGISQKYGLYTFWNCDNNNSTIFNIIKIKNLWKELRIKENANIYNKTLLNAHSHTKFNKLHLSLKKTSTTTKCSTTTHVYKGIEHTEKHDGKSTISVWMSWVYGTVCAAELVCSREFTPISSILHETIFDFDVPRKMFRTLQLVCERC